MGFLDEIPFLTQSSVLKATGNDPDSPWLHEAMQGPHKDKFFKAMANEIKELEDHGTWKVIRRSEVPHTNILPSTWVFKIKQFPDGILRNLRPGSV